MEWSSPRPPSGGAESAEAGELLTLPGPSGSAEVSRSALVLACSEPVITQRLVPHLGPRPLRVWRSPGPQLASPDGTLLPDLALLLDAALARHGVQEIVVCGHVGCQWLKQFWEGKGVGQDEPLPLAPLVLRQAVRSQVRGASPEEIERTLAEQHVASQIAQLHNHPAVAQRLAEGALKLHAWIYDERAEAVYGRGPADSPLLKWLRGARTPLDSWTPVFDPCHTYLA